MREQGGGATPRTASSSDDPASLFRVRQATTVALPCCSMPTAARASASGSSLRTTPARGSNDDTIAIRLQDRMTPDDYAYVVQCPQAIGC